LDNKSRRDNSPGSYGMDLREILSIYKVAVMYVMYEFMYGVSHGPLM